VRVCYPPAMTAVGDGFGTGGPVDLDPLVRAHRLLVEFRTVALRVEDELGRQALAGGASMAEIARAMGTSECEAARRLRKP
jgi:AraC-like DNA-binding protein